MNQNKTLRTIRFNIVSISAHISNKDNEYIRLKVQDLKSGNLQSFHLFTDRRETEIILNQLFKVDAQHTINVERLFNTLYNNKLAGLSIINRFVRNPYEGLVDETYPSVFSLHRIWEVEDPIEEYIQKKVFTLNKRKD